MLKQYLAIRLKFRNSFSSLWLSSNRMSFLEGFCFTFAYRQQKQGSPCLLWRYLAIKDNTFLEAFTIILRRLAQLTTSKEIEATLVNFTSGKRFQFSAIILLPFLEVDQALKRIDLSLVSPHSKKTSIARGQKGLSLT